MSLLPPSTREGDNHRAPAPSGVLLVSTLAMIGSSAVVALAFWLGAAWLKEAAFGLPAGVWIVVLLTAVIARQQRAQGFKGQSSDQSRQSLRPHGRTAPSRLGGRVRLAAARFAGAVCDGIERVQDLLGRTSWGERFSDRSWRARMAWRLLRVPLPVAPLRVGFAMPRRRAELVIDQDPTGAEWFMVARGADAQEVAHENALDTVVAELAPGVIRIETLERSQGECAWFDWGTRRPLSYESCFPLRIDPSHVHMDLSSEGELAGSADIVTDLVNAASVLSRHPLRLDVTDVILGRRSCITPRDQEELESYAIESDEGAAAMSRLADRLEQRSRASRHTAADRAAARAVSAWLSTWDESVRETQRLGWIEACGRILCDEPEVLLRLGAVRLSMMDDEMGIAALRDADALLQNEEGLATTDPIAFLESELEHGPENPMTVSRVAAGLCLAFAGVPTQRLAFVQEDLLDDMRFASWLVGRDQDRALLMRVLRELREAREQRDAMRSGQDIPPAQAA
jgi:hypothetical protein